MAFNPFHAFRKYKKSMFAILAIICMFTFVLSSGLGGKNDILNALPEMFGGGSSRYPEVARIDGKKIDDRVLRQTRVRRQMANEYITEMFKQAAFAFVERAGSRVKDDIALQLRLPTIAREKVMAAQYHTGAIYGSQNQQRGMSPPPPERALQDHIDFLTREIDRMTAEKKIDEADYLSSLRKLLEQDKARVNAIPTFGMFFGGSVQTGDDLLDFRVWKWEADRRNIVLTPDAVKKMVDQEMLGEDSETHTQTAVQFLAQN